MAGPAVGIFGLTGCAGDQLVLLNCEDELLDLLAAVDVRDFLTATSASDTRSNLDMSFVEGAVLSRLDEAALRRIRERSRLLVALGTCAVWGGVAAMNGPDGHGDALREVYGDAGAGYDSLPARALREVVKVDLNITGCPIEKYQLLAAVSSLLNGDPPLLPEYPLCGECRMRENGCLLIDRGEVCCGPLTMAGCEARCPSLGVACIGCRGPAPDANVASALVMFGERGVPRQEIVRKLRTFAPLGPLSAGRGGEA